jgi:hypothetical protein
MSLHDKQTRQVTEGEHILFSGYINSKEVFPNGFNPMRADIPSD